MSRSHLVAGIAKRFLRSKHSVGLISFSSYTSLIGVAIGVFALMISLSVLNGFEQEVSQRMMEFESHLRISASGISPFEIEDYSSRVRRIDKKAEIMPYVIRKALLVSGSENTVVRLKAAESSLLNRLIPLRDYIIKGDFLLEHSTSFPGIVLGYRIADRLGVDVYDTISVVSPLEIRTTLDIPPVQNCVITGIFRTDILDYDEAYAFLDISVGQRLFRMGNSFNGADIFLYNQKKLPEVQKELKKATGKKLSVRNWRELHQDLYDAMEMEKWGTFFALILIVVVASFNMVSGLIMMIMDKISEIGILMTLGLTRKDVKKVFLRMGFSTGLTGLITGLSISLVILIVQQIWQIIPLPGDVYFITYLPVQIKPTDLIAVTFLSLFIIFLASVYPARKAADMKPLKAIYFEK